MLDFSNIAVFRRVDNGCRCRAVLIVAAMAFQSAAVSRPGVYDIGAPVSMSATNSPSTPAVTAVPTARPPLALTVFEHGDPTPYEQHMLEMINRARADPEQEAARFGIDLNDGLAPGTISPDPKPPLSFHPLLITAARAHSQWMLDTDTFDHAGEGGSSPGDRMEAAGYQFSGFWSWTENIAWGGSSGTVDPAAQTLALHEALFLSPGHRQNILHEAVREIGVGSVLGSFTSGGIEYNALMITQNYAKSDDTPAPRVLGVVYGDGNAGYDAGDGESGVEVVVEDGNWRAVSSVSGGYALPYQGTAGVMRVVFSGGPLPAPLVMRIGKTGDNIKVDLDIDAARAMQVLSSGMTASGDGLRMTVDGWPDVAFDVQYSTNLIEWTTVENDHFDPTPRLLTHQPPHPAAAHFYRLRWSE